MIALTVASTMAGAVVAGWYGRRGLGRIQHWGEKMNEIDALYQSVASPEEMLRRDGQSVVDAASTSASRHGHARLAPGVPHGSV